MQADALLLCKYNIFGTKFNLDSIESSRIVASKEIIRVGHLFNKSITLLWVHSVVIVRNTSGKKKEIEKKREKEKKKEKEEKIIDQIWTFLA